MNKFDGEKKRGKQRKIRGCGRRTGGGEGRRKWKRGWKGSKFNVFAPRMTETCDL